MGFEALWAQSGCFGLVVNANGVIVDATDSVVTFLGPKEAVIGTALTSWERPNNGYALVSPIGGSLRYRVQWRNSDDGIRFGWFQNIDSEASAIAQADRYADDLKQLEYAVSHDLMEPIRMVGGYLNLYMEAQKTGAGNLSYLVSAQSAIQTTRSFLTDFVKYLRLDSYQRESATFRDIDLNALVRDVLQSLQMLVEEADADVVYSRLPTIRGDARMWYQVFSNLIANALKYREPSRKCRVEISATETDEAFEITVSDNGRGIHASKLDRVFAPFVRGHKDVAGSGIGLSITKRCLEHHGARIRVASKLGAGAVFTVYLPKSRATRKATSTPS